MRFLMILPADHPAHAPPGPPRTPFALIGLAAVAREHGAEPSALLDVPVKDLARCLGEIPDPPALVGLEATSANRQRCLAAAGIVRELWPEALILLWGGAHESGRVSELAEDPRLDVVLVGEAELTLGELLDRKRPGEGWDGLQGALWREGGSLVAGGPAQVASDLDALPLPARDLLPPLDTPPRVGLVRTYRGCPYRCAYCRLGDGQVRKVRRHSADRVLQEIHQELERGAREIEFVDETFTLDRKAVLELCDALSREPKGLVWSCYTRVTHVDRELLERMSAAGCRHVFYGMGTGVARLGEVLETEVDLPAGRSAVRWTRAAGMSTTVAFNLGLPGETASESRRTIGYGLSLGASRLLFQPCTPFPGTRLFETARRTGEILHEDTSGIRLYKDLVYLPRGRRAWELRAHLLVARILARMGRWLPGR